MMIRCPGCGGRNPREALSCEWCHRSFIPSRQRGRSARWWGALSGVVIGVLLLFVGGLALVNAMRSTGRAAVAASAGRLAGAQPGRPGPAETGTDFDRGIGDGLAVARRALRADRWHGRP